MTRRRPTAKLSFLLFAATVLMAAQQVFALAMTFDQPPPTPDNLRDDRATLATRSPSAAATAAVEQRSAPGNAAALLGWLATLLVLLCCAPGLRVLAALVPRLHDHGPPAAIRRGPPFLHVAV